MTNLFDVHIRVPLEQLDEDFGKSRKITSEINLHSMFQSYLERISADFGEGHRATEYRCICDRGRRGTLRCHANTCQSTFSATSQKFSIGTYLHQHHRDVQFQVRPSVFHCPICPFFAFSGRLFC